MNTQRLSPARIVLIVVACTVLPLRAERAPSVPVPERAAGSTFSTTRGGTNPGAWHRGTPRASTAAMPSRPAGRSAAGAAAALLPQDSGGSGAGPGATSQAAYDATLLAPKCANPAAGCDSGTLLDGRGTMTDGSGQHAEPNQPNTIASSCTDGNSGTYHIEESVDRIVVSSVDGTPLHPGQLVRVDVTTWGFAFDDHLEVYYAADAAAPAWQLIDTREVGAGEGVYTSYFTLPTGRVQAVRARLHFGNYEGLDPRPCGTGEYNDHDDLAFTTATTRSDFADDGKGDLLWRHATRGEVWIWTMNGATPANQAYLGSVGDTNWEIRCVQDFTADGRADIFWRHRSTGDLFLWAMNGASIGAQAYVGAVSPEYDIVSSGDYDGDGHADILWRNTTTGEMWVWLMNGATPVTVTRLATIPLEYAVVGSGDFNGDGKADVLWHNATNGEVWIWTMNGNVVAAQTLLGTICDQDYHVVAIGDATGDGKADIIWRHSLIGQTWLWQMNGPSLGSVALVGTVGDTNYRIVAMTDYDGDGKADLLWRNQATGAVWNWRLDGGTLVSATLVTAIDDLGYRVIFSQ